MPAKPTNKKQQQSSAAAAGSSAPSNTTEKKKNLTERLLHHIEKSLSQQLSITPSLVVELSQQLEKATKEEALSFFLTLLEKSNDDGSTKLLKKSEVADSAFFSTLSTSLLASVVSSSVQNQINLFTPDELYRLLKQKQQQSTFGGESDKVFYEQAKQRLLFITACFLTGTVYANASSGKKEKSRPIYQRLIEDIQQDYRRLLKKRKELEKTSEDGAQIDEEEVLLQKKKEQAILSVLFVEALGVVLQSLKQQSKKGVVSKKDFDNFAFELESAFLPEIVDNTPTLDDESSDDEDEQPGEKKKKSLKDREVVFDGVYIRNMIESTYKTDLSHYILHHYIQWFSPSSINERNMILTAGKYREEEESTQFSILSTRSFMIALVEHVSNYRHLPVNCFLGHFLTKIAKPIIASALKKKKKTESEEYEQFELVKELIATFFTQLFSQMQVPPSLLSQPKSGSSVSDIIAQISTRKAYWWEVQVFQDILETLDDRSDKSVLNFVLGELVPLEEVGTSANPFLLMWASCLNECKQFLKSSASSSSSSTPTGGSALLNGLLMLVVKKQDKKRKRMTTENNEEPVSSEAEAIKNEYKMKKIRDQFQQYQLWLASQLRPRILSLTSNASLSKYLLSSESVLCKVANTLGRYTTENGRLASSTIKADKLKRATQEEEYDELSSQPKTARFLLKGLSSWLRDAIKHRVGTVTRSILLVLSQFDEQMEKVLEKKNQMDLVHDSLAQETEDKQKEWINEEAIRFLLSCFPTNVRVYDKSEDTFSAEDLLILLKKLLEVGSLSNNFSEKSKKASEDDREYIIRQKSYYGKDVVETASSLVKSVLNNLAVQEFNWMKHQFHSSNKEAEKQLTSSKSWSGEIYAYAIKLFGLDSDKKNAKQERRSRIFESREEDSTFKKLQSLLSRIQKDLDKINIGSASQASLDWSILSSLAIYCRQIMIAAFFDPWIIESEEQGQPMVEDLTKVFDILSTVSSNELIQICQKKDESMQDEVKPIEVLTDLLVVNINVEPYLTLVSRIVFMTVAKYLNEECLDELFSYLINDGEVEQEDEDEDSDDEEESDDEDVEIEDKEDEMQDEEVTTNEDTAIIANDEEEGGIDLNNPVDVSKVVEMIKERNERKKQKSEEKQQKLKRMEFAMNIVQILEGLCIKSVPQPVLILLLFKSTQYILDKLLTENTEDIAEHLKRTAGYATNTIFSKVLQLVLILTKEYRAQLLSDSQTTVNCAVVFDQDSKDTLFETALSYCVSFAQYGKSLSALQSKAKKAAASLSKGVSPSLNIEQCGMMLSIYIRLLSLLKSGSAKNSDADFVSLVEKMLFGGEKVVEDEDTTATSIELLVVLAQSDSFVASTLGHKIILFALNQVINSGDKKYRDRKSGKILAQQPSQREMYDKILVHLVKPYITTVTSGENKELKESANTVFLTVLDAYVKDICPSMRLIKSTTLKYKSLKKCVSVLIPVLEYLANHSSKDNNFSATQFKEMILCFYHVFCSKEKKSDDDKTSIWSQSLPLFEAWGKRWNLLDSTSSVQEFVKSTVESNDLDNKVAELLKTRREFFKKERRDRVKQKLQEEEAQRMEEENKKKRKRNERKSIASSEETSSQPEPPVKEEAKPVTEVKKEKQNGGETKKRKTTPTAFAFEEEDKPAELTIEEMKKKSGDIPAKKEETAKSQKSTSTPSTVNNKTKKSTSSFMKETASSAAKKTAPKPSQQTSSTKEKPTKKLKQ